ncbi:hypothetical protein E6O75_ATG00622 [Venturia nashicola]|uniref:Secreted protein n=1 Tax=Venturia nashicola TaxID=86259 RepID=A0A4Z1PEC3_9PEZI|nr:hypothetical protein E6O75_ATG00622 [Venturia nashicola]
MLHCCIINSLFIAIAWAGIHTEITATVFIVPRSINAQIADIEPTKILSIPISTSSHFPESNHLDLRQISPQTVHTESTVTCCLVKARAVAPTVLGLGAERPDGMVQDQILMTYPTTRTTVAR